MTAPEISANPDKELAKKLFNRAWELIDLPERTPEEDRLMLVTTCAAWYHWDKVGTEKNRAISDWQVAHVASLLGDGEIALSFANSAAERTAAGELEDWMTASAYEGLARAHAAAGHKAERDVYLRMAREALDEISEEGERAVLVPQIDSVPDVTG
jgi:hypothetical protein